jgi:2-oxoglutarate dehydrogenase E1 component
MSPVNGTKSSINGWNSDYIAQLYAQWSQDSGSVDSDWNSFFQGFELGKDLADSGDPVVRQAHDSGYVEGRQSAATEYERLQSRVDSLIYHYRDLGHLLAKLDPLGRNLDSHHLLDLEAFDLSEAHLDEVFQADKLMFGPARMTLREIVNVLHTIYCGTLGVEYMHIQNTPERRWLQRRLEQNLNRTEFPAGKRLRVLRKLHRALSFERFLHQNYVGQKRFSLEGGETLIPLLDSIIEHAPLEGIQEIVLGMAHRGRLNVLTNIMQKSYEEVFSEFEDNYTPGMVMGDGDVKYHKGYSSDWTTYHGHQVHLTLTANPSHLEAVNPVALGRVRAKQRRLGDTERRRVMGVLIHGDAAFPGQGIVAETLNMSQLAGYATGGTIHVIVNNQIGFTTLPSDSRSMRYATDVAKSIQAPIFHVNADDPEMVVHVAEIALEFKQAFKKDVVIDLVCLRRLGHNEGDEPSFTQPKLYEMIQNHPSSLEIYSRKLLAEGVATQERLDEISAEMHKSLTDAQERVKATGFTPRDKPFRDEWAAMQPMYSHDPVQTAPSLETILKVASVWESFPEGFEANTKVIRLLKKRLDAIRTGERFDWATGEALAIGSLLVEGTPVRISGQDSRRGTFSHRHAVVWDVNTSEMYIPMNHIEEGQARFCVYDSPLSEAGVLGFDYGYSLGNPDMLICWEAQFGDFANGAQVIIDQFISSSESKWARASGIVMLLPHGYEGQGPEHSSARLERFLQMCAEDNIQVANLTTPAQYFHALRRQMRRNFRKPLIIMTPKSLLRHPEATSTVNDLTGSRFHEVIADTIDPKSVERIVLCSGKLYYDLLETRNREKNERVALVRVEQYFPFPENQLIEALAPYTGAREILWAQEEPKNMGAWTFMAPRIAECLERPVRYVGRNAAASPATGSLKRHKLEQETIVREALTIGTSAPAKTKTKVTA